MDQYLKPSVDNTFSLVRGFKKGWTSGDLLKKDKTGKSPLDTVIEGIGGEPGVITITVGANDYLKECSFPESKLGKNCIDQEKIHQKVDAVDAPYRKNLHEILSRLVNETLAMIFITNYYGPDPENPDAVHIVTTHLNPIIEEKAAKFPGRVIRVDVYSHFVGHTCHISGEQWIDFGCFHPNNQGQQEIANLIRAAAKLYLEAP